ncbi:MAG: polysaccharide deacetylase [Desulfobacterales bacterium]|nr:polysaccharide deacetylase [Desulfobacterales bacterium]
MILNCALTFDFDAMSVWLGSYKSRNPSMISRGEFGAIAVPRILDILKKHNIFATFYIPGHTALAYPDIVKRINDEGHEIAHHGWVHENPANFDEANERNNLDRGLEALQKVACVTPNGYRSPSWDFSTRTIQLLLEYGFVYDSSLMGADFTPYYARKNDEFDDRNPYKFGPNVDIVELPVTWLMDDFVHFEFVDNDTFGLSAPSKVQEIWTKEFDYARNNELGGLYSITMHPQVIGRGHRLMMLERLIENFKSHDDVGFTTMIDYAKKWRTANPLETWVASGAPQATGGAGRDKL